MCYSLNIYLPVAVSRISVGSVSVAVVPVMVKGLLVTSLNTVSAPNDCVSNDCVIGESDSGGGVGVVIDGFVVVSIVCVVSIVWLCMLLIVSV